MTREETIKELSKLIFELGFEDNVDDKVYALNMAIKALEQESCEDVISREAVDDILCLYSDKDGLINARQAVRMVRELPSVQPSRKGYWKYFYQNYECSECGFIVADSDVEVDGYEFCPICGSYNGGGTDMRGDTE